MLVDYPRNQSNVGSGVFGLHTVILPKIKELFPLGNNSSTDLRRWLQGFSL